MTAAAAAYARAGARVRRGGRGLFGSVEVVLYCSCHVRASRDGEVFLFRFAVCRNASRTFALVCAPLLCRIHPSGVCYTKGAGSEEHVLSCVLSVISHVFLGEEQVCEPHAKRAPKGLVAPDLPRLVRRHVSFAVYRYLSYGNACGVLRFAHVQLRSLCNQTDGDPEELHDAISLYWRPGGEGWKGGGRPSPR